jgi:hypothetical protein
MSIILDLLRLPTVNIGKTFAMVTLFGSSEIIFIHHIN